MSSSPTWRPFLGVWPVADGVGARVWAPDVERLELVFESGARSGRATALAKGPDGYFTGAVPGVRPGDRYRYRVDGRGLFPDPASRFQPEGVHGPSQVVDASHFPWTDHDWRGTPRAELVIYELHVGTFTSDGTFASARDRLRDLADLGVNAIELMPVADFPGRRNWGYDGVDLFAPARCYGTPDDFRRLVNEAHRLGLSVLLDVVYNHLGSDGNYLATFSPYYFSATHRTPWGPAINLDGPLSAEVRRFLVENSLFWIHEFHLDGLRLDATHSLVDESPRHFLAELSATVHASVADRQLHVTAEDWRNLAVMLRTEQAGGWGLDAVWVDDFHHQLRRYLVGDSEGTFRDFRGTVSDLVTTIRRGWFFCGEYSAHRGCARGSDPTGIAPDRFVYFIQNHDRIGNRALGERLNHQVDLATYRAASVLLLGLRQIPLLFMGQEWAATSPFLFFTDHEPELGRRVQEGRRHEFRHYSAFRDPTQLETLPDTQAPETFERCKLDWSERERDPHAGVLRFYRALLRLRRELFASDRESVNDQAVHDAGTDALVVHRRGADGAPILLAIQLKGAGEVLLEPSGGTRTDLGSAPRVLLSTEEPAYASDPCPITLISEGSQVRIRFERPGAVIVRWAAPVDHHRSG